MNRTFTTTTEDKPVVFTVRMDGSYVGFYADDTRIAFIGKDADGSGRLYIQGNNAGALAALGLKETSRGRIDVQP